MTNWRRASIAGTAAIVLIAGGCATKGALREGLSAQQAELASQREALEAERAERLAADQRLAADLGSLNSDLAMLSDDFGVRIAQLEDGIEFAVPVHFAFDAATVDDDARPALERFAELVQRHYPGTMITVEGFADPAGPAAYNRSLSQRRADAVLESLVAMGIPDAQLRSVGYGEERPVVPGAAGGADGAALNRRVVFVVETPQQVGVVGVAAGR